MYSAPNRRILLVDDTSSIHEDFRKILRPPRAPDPDFEDLKASLFGAKPAVALPSYELDSAYQGQEAWSMVSAALRADTPYALAFIDMRMPPGWDGVETIARLWEIDCQLQVVVCTAYSDYSLEEVLAKLEASDRLLILKKPFDAVEVQQLAGAMTTKWQMARQARVAMEELENRVQERTISLERANACLQQEIQERRSVEHELRLKHRAIEASINAIFLIKNEGQASAIEYINPAFEKLTGFHGAEAIGRSIEFLHGSEQEQAGIAVLQDALRRNVEGRAVLHSYRKDGTAFWSEWYLAPVLDQDRQASYFVGILNDISEARALSEQLQKRANYDHLTGLPNRQLLMDRMQLAFAAAERHQTQVVSAFLDLDRFKVINDSLGHEAGDVLLKEVAARLLECLRESDTVARLGGDEFVVLLPRGPSESAVTQAMQRIIEQVSRPVTLRGELHAVTCSIGVAVYPDDGRDPVTILKHADLALYQAKEIGRNRFQFFTAEMNARVDQRLKLEQALALALEQEQFELYYQPQLDLHNGAVIGCEALIRWNDPQRGLVMPGDFIPLAEESELILHIGEWVLRRACQQRAAWTRQGMRALPLSINLSARQFDRHDIPAMVSELIAQTGVDPAMLELEITESLSMREPAKTIEFIHALRAMKVGVAIDDFGTGYSNLSYLKQFPADRIKLDRSFIHDIVNNPDDVAISSAIIEMGHSLRLKVIAEGVERASQLAVLRALGCDQMQGFLFRPALKASEFFMLVQSDTRLQLQARQSAASGTLLLVDDEAPVRAAMMRELGKEPFEILQAGSAAEALAVLENRAVDVVLCDYQMPGMNGLDFLSHLEQSAPQVVRMMLSGRTDKAILLDALNRGTVSQFLCKPWEHDTLLAALNQAFRQAQYKRRKPTILLVDDDAGSLQLSAFVLAHQSYQVLCADNVGDALELLAMHEIDVVLSDYRMPDMSGLVFLGRVQKIYPRCVRMVLSAFSESASLLSAINSGLVFRYLSKPCAPQELLAAVASAFGKAQQLAETSSDRRNV